MPDPGAPATQRPRFVVGTMTGTSIDGDLDAALVAIEGRGLSMRPRVVGARSHRLGALADDLRAIARQEALPAREFARIARAFGEAHAAALQALCADHGVQPDLAVLHGQTVFHTPPLTWQLLDPWPVAVQLGCRVRFDLRGANVASGGEGAPITPLADFVLFGDEHRERIVVNLGGFVNATLVPARTRGPSAVRGFDVCACNHLLDAVARTRLGAAFDADGACAARGRADDATVQAIADQLRPGTGERRSLGTGDEAARLVERTAGLSEQDACRTIAEAVAAGIVSGLGDMLARPDGARPELLLAGGSARHRALREALARRWSGPVRTTEESHGVGVGVREAAEMAILGALADDGVSYALPAVTGRASKALDSAAIEPRHTPDA